MYGMVKAPYWLQCSAAKRTATVTTITVRL